MYRSSHKVIVWFLYQHRPPLLPWPLDIVCSPASIAAAFNASDTQQLQQQQIRLWLSIFALTTWDLTVHLHRTPLIQRRLVRWPYSGPGDWRSLAVYFIDTVANIVLVVIIIDDDCYCRCRIRSYCWFCYNLSPGSSNGALGKGLRWKTFPLCVASQIGSCGRAHLYSTSVGLHVARAWQLLISKRRCRASQKFDLQRSVGNGRVIVDGRRKDRVN